MPIYRRVNKEFFKKWTPEMFYILGFFAADGYITVNRRGGQFWCIQITDKKLLEQIKKTIDAEHKISIRLGTGNRSDLYRLQIGSIEMCNDLRKLGFNDNKTEHLSLPHVPAKYLSHFVRGYFDGDGNVWIGYIHKERIKRLRTIRTIFTSCSGKFLAVLKQKLEEQGIKKGTIRKEKGSYSRLTYSMYGSLSLYDFMYNSFILKDSIFLQRKKSIFEKYKSLRA